MFYFFKRTVLLIAISLHICAMTDENLSQSELNIKNNGMKAKTEGNLRPAKRKRQSLKQAAKGTQSILGFLQPISQGEPSICSNSLTRSRSSSTPSHSEIPSASSAKVINRKTEKKDTSGLAVFSIVSSAFFTEKVVRVPFFPEDQNAIAQIICIEENQYWSKFLINSKLKHEVVHCFDDRESAEKWIFDIAKRLKITLEAR